MLIARFPHLPLVTPREKPVAFIEMKATVIEEYTGIPAADYAPVEDLSNLWTWDIDESLEVYRGPIMIDPWTTYRNHTPWC